MVTNLPWSPPQCLQWINLVYITHWAQSRVWCFIRRSLHISWGSEPVDSEEHTSGDLCGHRWGSAACQGGRHVRQDRSHGALQTKGLCVCVCVTHLPVGLMQGKPADGTRPMSSNPVIYIIQPLKFSSQPLPANPSRIEMHSQINSQIEFPQRPHLEVRGSKWRRWVWVHCNCLTLCSFNTFSCRFLFLAGDVICSMNHLC